MKLTSLPPTASKANGAIPNEAAKIPDAIIDATPPPISRPYASANALDDLAPVVYALELFLASHMVESEQYCEKSDPQRCVARRQEPFTF